MIYVLHPLGQFFRLPKSLAGAATKVTEYSPSTMTYLGGYVRKFQQFFQLIKLPCTFIMKPPN